MPITWTGKCPCGHPITSTEAQKYNGRCFQCYLDDQETCDVCGKRLDKLRGEDIYIEERNMVLCGGCWEEVNHDQPRED